jgi:hypothetical protein
MMNNKRKHIDNQEITLLIERYFEGLTTTDEEALLQHYFQQEPIDDDLLIYKPLFAAWADLREMPEELILTASNLTERDTKDDASGAKNLLKMNALRSSQKQFAFFAVNKWKIVSMASGVAAILVIGFFTLFYESPTVNYVMIDGQKYTDKTLIMHNFEQSLDNVKIDMNDMLSEFQTLDIEP